MTSYILIIQYHLRDSLKQHPMTLWMITKQEQQATVLRSRCAIVNSLREVIAISTYPRLCIDVSPVSQKDANDVGLVGSRRQVECRLPTYGRHIGVGTMLDQEDDDVHVSHEGGDVEGAQARLQITLQIRATNIDTSDNVHDV